MSNDMNENPHLKDEHSIKWHKDPHKYPYLRENVAIVPRKDVWLKKYYNKIGTLIGYVILKPEAKAIKAYYYRRYWWIKDRTGKPAYDPYVSGYPGEAVKPSTIAVGTKSERGRD